MVNKLKKKDLPAIIGCLICNISLRKKKSSSLADKLTRFFYRKLQLAIITKCIEYNVSVILIKVIKTLAPRHGSWAPIQ